MNEQEAIETVRDPRAEQRDGVSGSGARLSRARWAIVAGAGLPALCVGLLFAWVVIPHLRFRYHIHLLTSSDEEARREAARGLARLGTEEAVRALLMEIRSGIEKTPEEPDEIEEGLSSFRLSRESCLLLAAFREADPAALPVFVDFLCSGDVRDYGAGVCALATFIEARDQDEDSQGDLLHQLEDLGVSPDLVARATSCSRKMEEEQKPVFWQEVVDK